MNDRRPPPSNKPTNPYSSKERSPATEIPSQPRQLVLEIRNILRRGPTQAEAQRAKAEKS